ncbi:ferritin-like domain-containing protein [Hymenobacter cellulosilyticus]|uniref:Ferritin-like domain-containing protein n=1 Tax=Hymenobacter cellulosilyticus TaxID=2932248 RepID=A0A8T9PYQ5_9BACT|nr:ferritin-like domain-containing protein [Hymenobacter cellulosilyticus]UOQ70374.1 ferritin-like domain-containing protein [Hymenobacter cellulosilyticus]
MKSMLPVSIRREAVATPVLPGRRSFLFYSGAGMALGSLWLAGCKDDEVTPAPVPAPTLTSFTPSTGTPGTTITVTGTNFAGTTAVTVGGAAAPFTVVSATTLTLTIPATATTGSIAVSTPGGTATSTTPLTVLPPASTITSFTPASAFPGATVTLTGTNFTGATGVTVGGVAVATYSVVNATTLTLVVPNTAQTGLIVITTPSGTGTSTTPLTVLPLYVNVGSGDLGVLNYAYALEQLEAAFYEAVKKGAYYAQAPVAEKQALADISNHENVHRDLLRNVLGNNAIKTLETDFSSIDVTSRSQVLAAARQFEDLGVAAYNGAARFLTNPAYLALAGKIVSVEARHAGLIRDLVSYNSFVDADVVNVSRGLELSKRPAVVAELVNTYLEPGSKLDVSGLK